MYRKRHVRKLRRTLAILSAVLLAAGAIVYVYPSYTEFKSAREKEALIALLDAEINRIQEEDSRIMKVKKRRLSGRDLYGDASRKVRPFLRRLELSGIIEIPELKLRCPIAEGTGRKDIRASIGHMDESDWVDQENGTCVLAGHRGGIYGEFFRNIDKLGRKSMVRVIALDGTTYTFAPYEKKVIAPTDRNEALKKIRSQTTLTLLSCNGNGKMRLIVRCRLVKIQ